MNGANAHYVVTTILVFQNNETAAMLVYQTNPVGLQLFSYVKTFFNFVPVNLHGCWTRGRIHSVWSSSILMHRSSSAHSIESTEICMKIVYLFDTANVESNKCMTMNMSTFELGRFSLILLYRSEDLHYAGKNSF